MDILEDLKKTFFKITGTDMDIDTEIFRYNSKISISDIVYYFLEIEKKYNVPVHLILTPDNDKITLQSLYQILVREVSD